MEFGIQSLEFGVTRGKGRALRSSELIEKISGSEEADLEYSGLQVGEEHLALTPRPHLK
jgi:hypothetical protein